MDLADVTLACAAHHGGYRSIATLDRTEFGV